MRFLGDLNTRNLILLDVKYSRVKEEGKTNDYAMFLFKNVETGEKFVYNVKNPDVEIYFTKPEYRDYDYNTTAIEKEKVYVKKVPYRRVLRSIADEAGGDWKGYYERCLEQGQYKAAKNLFHYNYSYGADMDICDYYRCFWALEYLNREAPANLTKMFLDIETDGLEVAGVPLHGTVPINAISLTDTESKTVYEFLLRNSVKENPQIAEFEKNIDKFIETCHEYFDEDFPGFDYKILMFDDEREMLKTLFALIKKLNRDFCGIWNMGYDIPYIRDRCEVLGLDFIELIGDSDFAVQFANYWEDKNAGVPVEKKDTFDCSSKTIYTDCMLNYGKIRKGRGVIRSLKLGYIAKIELGTSKIDYSDVANIKTLPYEDYWLFVLYSIKDTLLLHGIEKRTEYIDNVFLRATLNGAAYKNIFSQTKFLKTRFFIESWIDGFVGGNNSNMDYSAPFGQQDDGEREKFDGAVVGDPELNAHVGVNVFGKRSKYVFQYVIDMDFSSMYPWSIISFNISAHTMIGKLIIDNEYYNHNKKEPLSDKDTDGGIESKELKFEAGKQFVEDMLSSDLLRMGRNWFNLPSLEEMFDELEIKEPLVETKPPKPKDVIRLHIGA